MDRDFAFTISRAVLFGALLVSLIAWLATTSVLTKAVLDVSLVAAGLHLVVFAERHARRMHRDFPVYTGLFGSWPKWVFWLIGLAWVVYGAVALYGVLPPG